MRQLILMRHAKSSWDDPALADSDRPLNKRGRRGAVLVAEWLKRNARPPEHALVSAALRTRETWDLVARSLGPVPAEVLPELYHAGPDALLAALRRTKPVAVLMMVGHQPGIGALARDLLAEPPEDDDFRKFPTAAAAVIAFDAADWAATDWGTGRLAGFAVPRALE